MIRSLKRILVKIAGFGIAKQQPEIPISDATICSTPKLLCYYVIFCCYLSVHIHVEQHWKAAAASALAPGPWLLLPPLLPGHFYRTVLTLLLLPLLLPHACCCSNAALHGSLVWRFWSLLLLLLQYENDRYCAAATLSLPLLVQHSTSHLIA